MWIKALTWICRIALGGMFLYAGFIKVYPPEHRFLFEMTLSSYQLLPEPVVIALALVLPWVEMALGLLLLLGWRLLVVASVTLVILAGFLAAMAVTWLRGIEANCGCFGFDEPISAATLARDSLFVVAAAFVAFSAKMGKSRTPEAH